MEAVDYVIVGAGSAGCVLVLRLSQDTACEVALLEAGNNDHSHAVHQPNLWPLLWDAAEAWGYATSKESGYAFSHHRSPMWEDSGRLSSLNSMASMFDPDSPNKYSLAFIEAAAACGHRRNPDATNFVRGRVRPALGRAARREASVERAAFETEY